VNEPMSKSHKPEHAITCPHCNKQFQVRVFVKDLKTGRYQPEPSKPVEYTGVMPLGADLMRDAAGSIPISTD